MAKQKQIGMIALGAVFCLLLGASSFGYLALANTAVDGQFYNVAVVNPVFATFVLDHSYTPAQSQLVYLPVSVPEAGALLLFGTGLVGLVRYRRVRRML